ncbi:hypothetical protein RHGRI_021304 [Rhododendron griersonianum]|uniref:Uncharacterized protein n=1 Tax=Rhododendron griersonianum TaxID=479676 RepID=A0AAV6JJS2_9ERIC|nr:hypothetical protein RHGRI_021304 [Rhododendron griersonianum]
MMDFGELTLLRAFDYLVKNDNEGKAFLAKNTRHRTVSVEGFCNKNDEKHRTVSVDGFCKKDDENQTRVLSSSWILTKF